MNYYVIRPSADKNVTGHYPQVKSVKHNCHVWDELKFVEHIHFEKVAYKPITSNAILFNTSRPTDLINISSIGFNKKLLVSTKLKGVFSKFKQKGIQFFKSPIVHKGRYLEDYWLLNMYEFNMDLIDYNRSKIFKTKNAMNFDKQLEVKNYDEFVELKRNIDEEGYPSGIVITEIKLKEKIEADFFLLHSVEGGVKYIVSQKIKNLVELEHCTGIEFMPIEIKLSEWLQGGEREKIYGKT